jgi:putative phosphoesterase
MIAGVMSDTHGNLGLLNRSAEMMIKKFGVTRIYHLGDDYPDSNSLLRRCIEVVRVPGIYDREYGLPEIPKRVTQTVSGQTVLAVHAEKTVPQNEIDGADLVLVGHTHLYEIRNAGDTVVFNPGHLKNANDKGRKPTFGVLQIDDHSVRLTVCDLNGNTVETRLVTR